MEQIREWLTSVIAVSMLLSLVQMLIPKGSVEKTASFAGGLLLLLALLRPLLRMDMGEILPQTDGGRQTAAQLQEELTETTENLLEQCIAERTETYILDQAAALEAEVSVRVRTERSPEGIPMPAAVELTGAYEPGLERYIAEELGISAERQTWYENEN